MERDYPSRFALVNSLRLRSDNAGTGREKVNEKRERRRGSYMSRKE